MIVVLNIAKQILQYQSEFMKEVNSKKSLIRHIKGDEVWYRYNKFIRHINKNTFRYETATDMFNNMNNKIERYLYLKNKHDRRNKLKKIINRINEHKD